MSKHPTHSIQFTLSWQGLLSDYVRAIAWSNQEQILAASSAAGEVILWDTDSMIQLQSATDESVDCLGFSSNGQFLAVGGQAGWVKIWDISTQTLIATLENSSAWIDCLEWSLTENILAFGVNRQVKIWDISTQEFQAILDFQNSSILSLNWHSQGQHLAVGGQGGVKVWNRNNWEAEPTFMTVPGASLDTAWSKVGNYLASGNLDRTISLMEWGNPPPWLMQGFPGKVNYVAWSNTSPQLASACQEGIVIWERQGDNWQSHVLDAHTGFVDAIAFSPGQSILASAGRDGCIYLWDKAKHHIQTLTGVETGFSCLAWSPSGHQLAAGGQEGDLLIWTES